MRGIFPAGLLLALCAFPAQGAEPPQAEGYRCTIDDKRNRSTSEILAVTDGELVFLAGELDEGETGLTKQETVRDGSTEAVTTHTIDPETGEYRSLTSLTDHAFGEQYLIEASGVCHPLDGAAR